MFSSYSTPARLKCTKLKNNCGARLVIQICEWGMQFSFIIEYSWRVKMTLKHRQQHTTDARPRDDVQKVSIKDRKFLWHASECWGKRIQLLSSCDAINLHACLKRAKDHDLAICIYMQGRYIRDQDNHTGGTADVDWCRGYTPSDPDGDLDVVEDLCCPRWVYAIIYDIYMQLYQTWNSIGSRSRMSHDLIVALL